MTKAVPGAKRGRPRKDGDRNSRGTLLPSDPASVARRTAEAEKLKLKLEEVKRREQRWREHQRLLDEAMAEVTIQNYAQTQIFGQNLLRDAFNELERGARDKAHIIAQPHRQSAGQDRMSQFDPMAESALGRFILKYDLDTDVYRAGQDYYELRKCLNRSWGGPRETGTPGDNPSGSGDGPTIELAAEWRGQLIEIESVVNASGPQTAKRIYRLVLQGLDLDPSLRRQEIGQVKTGLEAMAKAAAKVFRNSS